MSAWAKRSSVTIVWNEPSIGYLHIIFEIKKWDDIYKIRATPTTNIIFHIFNNKTCKLLKVVVIKNVLQRETLMNHIFDNKEKHYYETYI